MEHLSALARRISASHVRVRVRRTDEDVKVKNEPAYGYDTDDNGEHHFLHQSEASPPSPGVKTTADGPDNNDIMGGGSSSTNDVAQATPSSPIGLQTKVKEEEHYDCDTDDDHGQTNAGSKIEAKQSNDIPHGSVTPMPSSSKKRKSDSTTAEKNHDENPGVEINDAKAQANFSGGSVTTSLTSSSQNKKRDLAQNDHIENDAEEANNDSSHYVTSMTLSSRKRKSNIPQELPGKKMKGSKSTKQKEKPRINIAKDFTILSMLLTKSSAWHVTQSSFQTSKKTPLDFVQFDEKSKRYQTETGSDFVEDDVILQSMVVYALYRMEKGWGKPRSNKALSVWGGQPATDTDEHFPLENLWKEEMQQLMAEKKLGPRTLNHPDNYYVFPHFYLPERQSKWARRSGSYLGQLHILAEQATVQLAMHLHERVSKNYARLASMIVHSALSGDVARVKSLSDSLLQSARKESDCFATTALDDIEHVLKMEVQKMKCTIM